MISDLSFLLKPTMLVVVDADDLTDLSTHPGGKFHIDRPIETPFGLPNVAVDNLLTQNLERNSKTGTGASRC